MAKGSSGVPSQGDGTHFLYVEIPGYKKFPSAEYLKNLHKKDDFHLVLSESAALAALRGSTQPFDAMICNAPLATVFKASTLPNGTKGSAAWRTILFSDLIIDEYHQELINDALLVDHIIANHLPEDLSERELAATIEKIKSARSNRRVKFGLEPYLDADSLMSESHTVATSAERDHVLQKMADFAGNFPMRGILKKQFAIVGEELLMNAIYDAPYAAGLYKEQDQERTLRIELKANERATLTYACDGKRFAISVSDPFGLLSREGFFRYCSKITQRNLGEKILDKKIRGAGIGIYMILYNSHALICNVLKGKQTEVIALIDLKMPLRDFGHSARSIHYFRD